MKRNVLLLVLFAVISLFLMLSLYFVSNPTFEKVPSQQSGSDISQSRKTEVITENIQSMIVSMQDSEVTFIKENDGDCFVLGLEKISVKQNLIAQMFQQMSSFTVEELDGSYESDKYGLSQPRAKITLVSDQGQKSIKVGNYVAAYPGYYISIDGSSGVYLIQGSVIDPMLGELFSYADTGLSKHVTVPQSYKLQKLELDGTLHQDKIILECISDSTGTENLPYRQYQITQPSIKPVDTEELAKFNNITKLQAQAVVAIAEDDAIRKKYGLLEPYVSMNYTYLSSQPNQPPFHLSVKFSQPSEGISYVLFNSDPAIYQVNVEDSIFLSLEYEDLVSRLLLTPKISTLESVLVEFTDRAYLCSFTVTDGTIESITVNEKNVNIDKFKKLYQNLLGIPADEYIQVSSSEASSSLLKITYTYNTGAKTDTMEFLTGPFLQAAISVNGQPAEFLTNIQYIETLKGNFIELLQGDEITSLF